MVYIRSRKFCCCIPVRFGVFVLTMLGFLGGGSVCITGWIAVSQLWKHQLPKTDTIGLYLHAAIFTILTLLSVFGFIGCLVKSRNSVYVYSIGISITLLLSIAAGSYFIWALFHENSETVIESCLNGDVNSISELFCKHGIDVYKGLIVAVYIVIWLLMIYAYVIVENYVEQLDDEMSPKESKQVINAISQTQVTVAVPA